MVSPLILTALTIAHSVSPATITSLEGGQPLKAASPFEEDSFTPPVRNEVARVLEASALPIHNTPFVPKQAHTPLQYGDTVTLMDAYSDYILCSLAGRA